jgi:prepilin signal peptidase PulO-like enzyme (type II secretory pathway)
MSDLPTREENNMDLKKTNKIEDWFGPHFNTVVVLILIMLFSLILIFYLIFAVHVEQYVFGSLIGLITTLLGYFIGKNNSDS